MEPTPVIFYALHGRRRLVRVVAAKTYEDLTQMLRRGIEITPGVMADSIGRFPGGADGFRRSIARQGLTLCEQPPVAPAHEFGGEQFGDRRTAEAV